MSKTEPMTAQNPASPDGEYVLVPRKAAKVFADIADQYSDREDDHFQVLSDMDVLAPRLLLKHFRDIRAALASAPRPDADAKLAEILRPFADFYNFYAETDSTFHCYVDAGRSEKVLDPKPFKRAADFLLSLTERAASLEHDLLIAHAAIIILKKAQAMKDRKLRKEAERGDTV